ncbi:hypothetical protein CAPTEDRAFT_211107 [Capitella teleta]|uniref:CARD domain-containing protein n=1 Tax=Capitella teleta TaxID=283909 RepID=R7TMZ4_CAPTE|nr:hypothetical protein CAPTEDRAFT_211107 [Capitella teleta]|eukprot:ELT95238.1 hypothetical protein CAPTEDRAFT_211107 [Capitella teleta]
MRMTDEHEAILLDHREFLVKTIQLHSLWTPLRACRIVTEYDEEEIRQRGGTRFRMVEKLLDHLVKRPDADFYQFCDCLRKTNQGHVSDVLEKSKQHYRPSTGIAHTNHVVYLLLTDESGVPVEADVALLQLILNIHRHSIFGSIPRHRHVFY